MKANFLQTTVVWNCIMLAGKLC